MIGLLAVLVAAAASGSVPWREALAQPPAWYAGDEAVRIADQVLLYQRDTGGWPKNIDMAAPLTEAQAAELSRQKLETDSTIDNGATWTQLRFLGRVYDAKRLPRHEQAFFRGIDYLLRAQYDNGGWPQYHPRLTGYFKRITYNDNAMTGVLALLRDLADAKPPLAFVDLERRARARKAVEKGIDCILNTQVVVNGKRTAWCAQHDEVTLAPASARTYELVSLSGYESVDIVHFLMSVPDPGPRVREAIHSAVEWFEAARLSGLRVVDRPNPSATSGFDRAVVSDPAAPPLWARFYEIGTNRPIFVGRDGVVKWSLAEIEKERRNNYRWYVTEPARLLGEEYPAWRARWGSHLARP